MEVPACARFERLSDGVYLVVYAGSACTGVPIALLPISPRISSALKERGWVFDWDTHLPCGDDLRSVYALRAA